MCVVKTHYRAVIGDQQLLFVTQVPQERGCRHVRGGANHPLVVAAHREAGDDTAPSQQYRATSNGASTEGIAGK